jgi:hypothetical protein
MNRVTEGLLFRIMYIVVLSVVNVMIGFFWPSSLVFLTQRLLIFFFLNFGVRVNASMQEVVTSYEIEVT